MKKISLAAAILALGVTGMALADSPADDSIKNRKAAFTLIKSNFGPMGAMAEGKVPFNKEAFALRAANLEALAKMPWEHFGAGTDKGETKSKPEVWSKAADYKAEADKFQTEAGKLAVVSKSGDEGAMKAQFGATAKTCKSCHEGFKNK